MIEIKELYITEVYKRKLNQEIMQQILDSFVELTGIRAAYFDNETAIIGNNKPLCEFCKKLRDFKELDTNCKISDDNAFKLAKETGKTYIYQCHMGLYEAVVPINIQHSHAGYLMLGQVACTEDAHFEINNLKEKLGSFNVDPEQTTQLLENFQTTTVMSKAKIEAAANMLGIIAQYMINTDVIYFYDIDSVEKAKFYIRQHYTKALSVRSIAEYSGLSPSYLSYLFKRETGVTITCYLDKQRLDRAKELLILTSKSMKEISSIVGYTDQNYFSRIFKKYEKISPVEYRTKNKNLC